MFRIAIRGTEVVSREMNGKEQRLLAIANYAAMRRGTEVGEARFSRSGRFAYRWRMDGGRIAVLYVTDYLDEAPDRALLEFLEAVMDSVRGRTAAFGSAFMEYVTSDEFILGKRPVFLRRSRNIARTDTGRYRNIYDAAQRLLDAGLISPEDLDCTYFTWTSAPNYARLGYCHRMFRVVAVSSVLDDPAVPEYVFDFVVYHECLHLRQGYRPFDRHPHDAAFCRQERLHPRYAEAEAYMKRFPAMGRDRRTGK